MGIQMSVCGLYVISGVVLADSKPGLYHVEVAEEEDQRTAVAFAQQMVRDEALAIGVQDTSTFYVSSLHPGWVDRCPGIEVAEEEVDEARENEIYSDHAVYTVCGMYSDNCETYCDSWVARGPGMAYLEAWYHVDQREKRNLFVTCVHEGDIPRFCFPFAEPSCTSDPMMRDYMKECGL